MELYEHLALAKNLRGIIYFNPRLNVKEEITWLRKKFKYRDIGIGRKLAEKVEGFSKKLTVLDLPFGEEEKIEVEALKLASAFVCPLIVLKEESLKDYGKLGVMVKDIKIEEKLSDLELKRNLRLVNYSITDFYEKSIKLALEGNLKERRHLIDNDCKRFWRLKASETGRTLIFYIDPIKVVENNPIFLSIVPGIVIEIN
ncbi:MAG: hypothetical protein QW667_05240 [Candidatus Bathyarchaeia archaeon]